MSLESLVKDRYDKREDCNLYFFNLPPSSYGGNFHISQGLLFRLCLISCQNKYLSLLSCVLYTTVSFCTKQRSSVASDILYSNRFFRVMVVVPSSPPKVGKVVSFLSSFLKFSETDLRECWPGFECASVYGILKSPLV